MAAALLSGWEVAEISHRLLVVVVSYFSWCRLPSGRHPAEALLGPHRRSLWLELAELEHIFEQQPSVLA
jgi:hypothetical protein